MHPATMGMAFKFICFEKNVPPSDELLTGFRHSNRGRETLRLPEPKRAGGGDPADPYAAF